MTETLVTWLQNYPHWAGFFVFLVAAGESLAVVGLFVPGAVFMWSVGGLIGADLLNFWAVAVWAVAGAICGDGLSFLIGRYFGHHLDHIWPFKYHMDWIRKGERFFLKYGEISVVVGRFVGPVRPFVPLAAGMLHMPPWRFFAANVISALLWAPAYLLPGMLLGWGSQAAVG